MSAEVSVYHIVNMKGVVRVVLFAHAPQHSFYFGYLPMNWGIFFQLKYGSTPGVMGGQTAKVNIKHRHEMSSCSLASTAFV